MTLKKPHLPTRRVIGGSATGRAISWARVHGTVIPSSAGGVADPPPLWPRWTNQREPRDHKVEITEQVGVTDNVSYIHEQRMRSFEEALEALSSFSWFLFWMGLLMAALVQVLINVLILTYFT